MSATNSLRPQHYFGAYDELSYCSRQAEEPDSKQLTDIASSSTADRDDDSRVMRQPEGSQRVGVHSKIHELPTKQPRTQRTVRPRRDGNTKRTVQQQRMELLRVERELEKLKLLMELRHLEQKIAEGSKSSDVGSIPAAPKSSLQNYIKEHHVSVSNTIPRQSTSKSNLARQTIQAIPKHVVTGSHPTRIRRRTIAEHVVSTTGRLGSSQSCAYPSTRSVGEATLNSTETSETTRSKISQAVSLPEGRQSTRKAIRSTTTKKYEIGSRASLGTTGYHPPKGYGYSAANDSVNDVPTMKLQKSGCDWRPSIGTSDRGTSAIAIPDNTESLILKNILETNNVMDFIKITRMLTDQSGTAENISSSTVSNSKESNQICQAHHENQPAVNSNQQLLIESSTSSLPSVDIERSNEIVTATATIANAKDHVADIDRSSEVVTATATIANAKDHCADIDRSSEVVTSTATIGNAEDHGADIDRSSEVVTTKATIANAEDHGADIDRSNEVVTATAIIGNAEDHGADIDRSSEVVTTTATIGNAEDHDADIDRSNEIETATSTLGNAEDHGADIEHSSEIETATATIANAKDHGSDVERSSEIETATSTIANAKDRGALVGTDRWIHATASSDTYHRQNENWNREKPISDTLTSTQSNYCEIRRRSEPRRSFVPDLSESDDDNVNSTRRAGRKPKSSDAMRSWLATTESKWSRHSFRNSRVSSQGTTVPAIVSDQQSSVEQSCTAPLANEEITIEFTQESTNDIEIPDLTKDWIESTEETLNVFRAVPQERESSEDLKQTLSSSSDDTESLAYTNVSRLSMVSKIGYAENMDSTSSDGGSSSTGTDLKVVHSTKIKMKRSGQRRRNRSRPTHLDDGASSNSSDSTGSSDIELTPEEIQAIAVLSQFEGGSRTSFETRVSQGFNASSQISGSNKCSRSEEFSSVDFAESTCKRSVSNRSERIVDPPRMITSDREYHLSLPLTKHVDSKSEVSSFVSNELRKDCCRGIHERSADMAVFVSDDSVTGPNRSISPNQVSSEQLERERSTRVNSDVALIGDSASNRNNDVDRRDRPDASDSLPDESESDDDGDDDDESNTNDDESNVSDDSGDSQSSGNMSDEPNAYTAEQSYALSILNRLQLSHQEKPRIPETSVTNSNRAEVDPLDPVDVVMNPESGVAGATGANFVNPSQPTQQIPNLVLEGSVIVASYADSDCSTRPQETVSPGGLVVHEGGYEPVQDDCESCVKTVLSGLSHGMNTDDTVTSSKEEERMVESDNDPLLCSQIPEIIESGNQLDEDSEKHSAPNVASFEMMRLSENENNVSLDGACFEVENSTSREESMYNSEAIDLLSSTRPDETGIMDQDLGSELMQPRQPGPGSMSNADNQDMAKAVFAYLKQLKLDQTALCFVKEWTKSYSTLPPDILVSGNLLWLPMPIDGNDTQIILVKNGSQVDPCRNKDIFSVASHSSLSHSKVALEGGEILSKYTSMEIQQCISNIFESSTVNLEAESIEVILPRKSFSEDEPSASDTQNTNPACDVLNSKSSDDAVAETDDEGGNIGKAMDNVEMNHTNKLMATVRAAGNLEFHEKDCDRSNEMLTDTKELRFPIGNQDGKSDGKCQSEAQVATPEDREDHDSSMEKKHTDDAYVSDNDEQTRCNYDTESCLQLVETMTTGNFEVVEAFVEDMNTMNSVCNGPDDVCASTSHGVKDSYDKQVGETSPARSMLIELHRSDDQDNIPSSSKGDRSDLRSSMDEVKVSPNTDCANVIGGTNATFSDSKPWESVVECNVEVKHEGEGCDDNESKVCCDNEDEVCSDDASRDNGKDCCVIHDVSDGSDNEGESSAEEDEEDISSQDKDDQEDSERDSSDDMEENTEDDAPSSRNVNELTLGPSDPDSSASEGDDDDSHSDEETEEGSSNESEENAESDDEDTDCEPDDDEGGHSGNTSGSECATTTNDLHTKSPKRGLTRTVSFDESPSVNVIPNVDSDTKLSLYYDKDDISRFRNEEKARKERKEAKRQQEAIQSTIGRATASMPSFWDNFK